MFKKILLAHDGSDGARRAHRVSVELAKATGGSLHVLCVQEDLPKYAETLIELDDVKQRSDRYFGSVLREAEEYAREQGIEIATHLSVGHEVDAIVRFAVEGGFDLLVLGYHGHSAISERLFGSTTSALVMHAPCSTLVVK
ncbi:MAG: universal stress protein [Fimbriimonadaceae bacterium]|nr:universal stress protein [Fimbriimonadaceae bacterium]